MNNHRGNPLRIGTVSYTNAFPLIEYLPQTCPSAEIIRVVPSKLGKLMEQGEVDLALLSSIELLKHPSYSYLPDISISSDGAVGSVLLFSKKPAAEIETVALDQSSLTSIVLTKILFHEYWQRGPVYVSYTPPVENGMNIADAALAIGDAGLIAEGKYPYCYDLGEIWKKHTGLPFVFALWIAQPMVDIEKWAPAFLEAKTQGMANIDLIVKRCTKLLAIPDKRFSRYFLENLRYDLGKQQIEGMNLFFQKANDQLELN